MCAGSAHSEAEKSTGQRRDEEGLLQRVRDPHTPAHEVRRAVALLFPKGVHRGRLSMYTSAISALGRAHACEEAVALLETMRQRALTPDVISYNAATSHFGSSHFGSSHFGSSHFGTTSSSVGKSVEPSSSH